MQKSWAFDSDLTRGYSEARREIASKFLEAVRRAMPMDTALDVGCGIGYFSKFLRDSGFHVMGLDGRQENVTEAKRRYPEITFVNRDVEAVGLEELGGFDLVLCFGLLYHLENPFRAIRNLHSITAKVLLVESMCAPGMLPSLQLVDESRAEDQGLNYVAFYPTEACLVKMLYRAGFSHVYGFAELPGHSAFRASMWKRKERTILAASKGPLAAECLRLLPDVKGSWEILWTSRERWRSRLERAVRMVRRKPNIAERRDAEKA